MRILATLIVLLGAVTSGRAQSLESSPEPLPQPNSSTPTEANRFYIPYNDHGIWGYCDTLGQVTIRPRYEKAGLFYNTLIGDRRTIVSQVTTRWGRNRLDQADKLLMPRKSDLVRRLTLTSSDPDSLFLLKNKRSQYGIYRYNVGWAVKATYDSIAPSIYVDDSWVLLKRAESDTYDYFDQATKSMQPSEIVEVQKFSYGYNTVGLGRTADNRFFALRNYQLERISDEDMAANYELEEELYFEAADLEDTFYDNGGYLFEDPLPNAQELGVDKIVQVKEYSRYGALTIKYGFRVMMIVEKEGQMGLYNGKGEAILPIQYDQVTFVETDTQVAIYKHGKVGRKLLFSHYPTIEPRYDDLRLYHQLRVSPRWSFALFKVSINGQDGFVGENAVEYFDLD